MSAFVVVILFAYLGLAYGSDSVTESKTSDYSIVSDLRDAFSPYSQMHAGTYDYSDHLSAIVPFSNSQLDTRFYVNSFDERKGKNKYGEHISPPTKEADGRESPPATHNESKEKPKSIHIIPKDIDSKIDLEMLSPKCKTRRFNLSKLENTDPKLVLNQLAQQCGFSIHYDHAMQINSTTVVNANQQPLDYILGLLLGDFFYEVAPQHLVVKNTDLRIFELNYVSSTRMAQSNTDVLFSQEQGGYRGGYGYGGYGFQSPFQNPAQNPLFQNSPFPAIENHALKQQLRHQMNNSISEFGRSGTKVYSLDETNLWADIESRLNILLDKKLGDKFMIDKSAGLISIWANKKRMREAKLFLENIESKMTLQVSLDVEILSLTHFNSSNIGIDWQEAFKILNPTQASFSLSTGGGSIFTIQGNTNLNPLFNFLRTYGNLRSLSNPKLMALNNQPAIISVGSVLRYSQELVYQSNNSNNTIQNTSTQYPSVFAGILLDITPSISQDEVVLRINPAITKTKNPELENTAQALSSPPNLSTNQLSSIVKLKDGQRVVIGGLLSTVSQSASKALPKIGEVMILDKIFGKQTRLQRSEELIIIISTRIVR